MAEQQRKVGPIAVCIHVFDSVDFNVYFNHLYCMAHWGKMYDLVFVGKSGLQAAKARNSIIERALKRECTHALFLDGDHFVPVKTLEFLLESGNEAIVSGVVCKRGEGFQQVCWETHVRNGKKQFYQVTLPLDGRVYEVSVCAFGCTLINLEKLQKLKKPYFRDTCEPDADGTPLNVRSDINICNMFTDIGEKVWVDTRILVGHLGVPGIVYPQGAPLFEKLKSIELESVKLSEGQQGLYYYPGDRS
jgi:hypothetical protein